MIERFVVVDTETTGLDDTLDRVLELAAVEIIDRRQTGATFRALINPEGRTIQYESYVVHKISEADVADAPTFQTVWPLFAEFIRTDSLVIHNAPFDIGFLNAGLDRLGKPPIANTVIDTIGLSRHLWPGSPASLDAILTRLGIDRSARADRHGALIDSQLLAQAFIQMLALRDSPRVQADLNLSNAQPIATNEGPAPALRRRPIARL